MKAMRPHWPAVMAPLPSEVLRALRAAQDARRSLCSRQRRLDDARFHLRNRKRALREWSASVDAMMRRRGVQSIDQMTALDVQAFLARLGDSGRRALEKRLVLEAAIATAEMLIDSIGKDLARGNER